MYALVRYFSFRLFLMLLLFIGIFSLAHEHHKYFSFPFFIYLLVNYPISLHFSCHPPSCSYKERRFHLSQSSLAHFSYFLTPSNQTLHSTLKKILKHHIDSLPNNHLITHQTTFKFLNRMAIHYFSCNLFASRNSILSLLPHFIKV